MSGDHENEIIHKELDTDADRPATEIVVAVADLRNKDVNELTTMWGCVDGMLDHLFSNPPADDAQMEVTFSYEGFRVTIDQYGSAKFVEP